MGRWLTTSSRGKREKAGTVFQNVRREVRPLFDENNGHAHTQRWFYRELTAAAAN
jgi:hypothetical protein